MTRKESLQRQQNRSTAEERQRAYTQASKAIRDKLQQEIEKAKQKGETRSKVYATYQSDSP